MAVSRRLLLSIPQVAEVLNVSVPTIKRWLSTGALPYLKLGGRTLIHQNTVDRVLAEGLNVPKQGAESQSTAGEFGPESGRIWLLAQTGSNLTGSEKRLLASDFASLSNL